jgi:hypothetical protein
MRIQLLLLPLIITSGLFSACGSAGQPPEPNTQATIDFAVQATITSQAADQATANAQATTDTAVAATSGAEQAVVPTTPATTSVGKTPAETDAELTEEELANLIDQAVNEAIMASAQSSATASDAAADGTVSPEEAQSVEVYVTGAEEAVALAEELIALYYNLYGVTTIQAIENLQEIEQTLTEIDAAVALLNTTLNQINTSLEQEPELATETLEKLVVAAAAIDSRVEIAQNQIQGWQEARTETGASQGATAQATHQNPQTTLQTVFEFTTIGRQAIADNNLSPEETSSPYRNGCYNRGKAQRLRRTSVAGINAVCRDSQWTYFWGRYTTARKKLEQLNIAAVVSAPTHPGYHCSTWSYSKCPGFCFPESTTGCYQTAIAGPVSATSSTCSQYQCQPERINYAPITTTIGLVNDIAGQVVLGREAQAQLQLNQLETSLNSLPEINLPELPDKPSMSDQEK